MIFFIVLFFISSLLSENSSINENKEHTFIKDSQTTEEIYFNQLSLAEIRFHLYYSGIKIFKPTLDNPRPLNTVDTIIEAFIEYGNEQGFDSKTKLGIMKIEGFFSDLSEQKPDLNAKKQETFEITSFVLDPELFNLSKTAHLEVIFDGKTQEIKISPELETLIKRIVDQKSEREQAKQNKYILFFDQKVLNPFKTKINSLVNKYISYIHSQNHCIRIIECGLLIYIASII